MIELLIVLACVFAYCVVVGVVYHAYMNKKEWADDELSCSFIGGLWPISLFLIFGVYIGRLIVGLFINLEEENE